MVRPFASLLILSVVFFLVQRAFSDEGMWVFNNIPYTLLEDDHGFQVPPGWADHLRLSAVRFNNGGSGSFVSGDGLIMTNHHVGADTLQKISTKEKDYYRDGFFAATTADEVKAPDLELNVLVGIENVTDKVNAAVKDGADPIAAGAARRKAMAEIEKAATDKNHLRNDVVTLYQGGEYHLYTYKRYTDVRLVFAPEFDIAFFGGDPDNFEYPRYDLDICFFRAYEDGKPAQIKDYLKWSPNGTKAGDLVFVAGHPGHTSRLLTVAGLEYLRDVSFPFTVAYLQNKEAFLIDYGKKGPEAFRQCKEDLFSVQNSRKARIGGLEGLRDEQFMARKRSEEKAFRDRLTAEVKKRTGCAEAWDKIAATRKIAASLMLDYTFYERGMAFDSHLFRVARTLMRLASEDKLPNQDRLKEYRESGRESLELALYSEAPIYPEYETASLAHSLAYWKTKRPDDPMLPKVLENRSPEEVAKELMAGSKLADVAVRKELAKGGQAAIDSSTDTMIKLAKLIDPPARAVRKKLEDEVEGVETELYARIAKARFAELGNSVYPDATFTLRLAFGVVKGYEQDGKKIPPYTTIGGAFEHETAHKAEPPYKLPESWHKAKDAGKLALDTPLDFVSTADIIGGNSGSPVVNRANEVVGIIFDGNIQSLVLDFGYDEKQARAVAVDSRGIFEALRSIYKVERLVDELKTGAMKK